MYQKEGERNGNAEHNRTLKENMLSKGNVGKMYSFF